MALSRRCLILMMLVMALISTPACNRATPPAVIPPDSSSPREGEQEEPQADIAHVLSGDIGLKPQYFFAAGELVFFRNELDEGRLYKINPICMTQEVLSEHPVDKAIATEDFVYFTDRETQLLLRARHDGNGTERITSEAVTEFMWHSEYIYFTYRETPGIFRISATGTLETVTNDPAVSLCAVGKSIFYVDSLANSIKTVLLDGSDPKEIVAPIDSPYRPTLIVDNTYIYYYYLVQPPSPESRSLLFRMQHGYSRDAEKIEYPGERILSMGESSFLFMSTNPIGRHVVQSMSLLDGEVSVVLGDERTDTHLTVTGDSLYLFDHLFDLSLHKLDLISGDNTTLLQGAYPVALTAYEDWLLTYCRQQGTQAISLTDDTTVAVPGGGLAIHDEWIYYRDQEAVYRQNLKTLEPPRLVIASTVRSFVISDGFILYTNESQMLYRANLDGTDTTELASRRGSILCAHQGWVYLSPSPSDSQSDPHLTRVRLNDPATVEEIANFAADSCAAHDDYLYFSTWRTPSLVYQYNSVEQSLTLLLEGAQVRHADAEWVYFFSTSGKGMQKMRHDSPGQTSLHAHAFIFLGTSGEWHYLASPGSGGSWYSDYLRIYRTSLDGVHTEFFLNVRGETVLLAGDFIVYPHAHEYRGIVRMDVDGANRTVLR